MNVPLNLDQISQDLDIFIAQKDAILARETQELERLRHELAQRQMQGQRPRNLVARVYRRILTLIR